MAKQSVGTAITSVVSGSTWTLLTEITLTNDSRLISIEISNAGAGAVRIKLAGRIQAGGNIEQLGELNKASNIQFGGTYPIPVGGDVNLHAEIPRPLYSVLVYALTSGATGNVSHTHLLSDAGT